MNLNRRRFAQSLTAAAGALVAGPKIHCGAAGTRVRCARARASPAVAGDRHENPRLLSAQLQPERPAGISAEQHGRPRRHRRGHHGHRPGWIAGHGPQRRPQRHRQERVRHRDDLAGRLHGRVLLARQGTAACARRHRPRPLGHQGQGAQHAALSVVRRQGARAHRALCDVGAAAGTGAAGRRRGNGLEGARGGDDGGGLSRLPRGRRHSAEHWTLRSGRRWRRCGRPGYRRAAGGAAAAGEAAAAAERSSIRDRGFARSFKRWSRFATASAPTAIG